MGKNKSVCLQGEMLTVVGYVNSLNLQVNITLYVYMWICKLLMFICRNNNFSCLHAEMLTPHAEMLTPHFYMWIY